MSTPLEDTARRLRQNQLEREVLIEHIFLLTAEESARTMRQALLKYFRVLRSSRFGGSDAGQAFSELLTTRHHLTDAAHTAALNGWRTQA